MKTSPRRSLPAMIPLILLLLMAGPSAGLHLQDAYNEAGPGEGYDRLVVLDPAEVYTGYLVVLGNSSCLLRGNGALIALDQGAQIWAGANTRLDVEGCTITGGSYGISYDYAISSTVSNCTLVGNGVGLRSWIADVTVTNCIIAGNDQYGIACREGYEPTVLYNNVWGNGDIDYAAFCPTWGGQTWESFSPRPGTGEISFDPLFHDPVSYDFNLQTGSQCIDRGDPDGPEDPDGSRRDMGALPTYKTAPMVLVTRPQTGEQEVPRQAAIEATFDMPMDADTFTGDHLIVSGEGGSRGGSIAYDPLTRTVIFTPEEAFQPGETVSVTLTGGIASLWDQALEADYGWSFQITTSTDVAVTETDGLPGRFELEQNYPNPFNAETTIRFTLDRSGPASLAVYNMLGQRVKVLHQGELAAGRHQVSWNGTDRRGRALASGVYFCRLQAGGRSEVSRMVLLR